MLRRLPQSINSFLTIALPFTAILALTLLAYWPALSGPFLLDDLLHLARLGGGNAVDDIGSFFSFIFSSDRTPGRFLSFASLLIDDFAWPANPTSFKYTNLMFHLLNGVLLFYFCQLVLKSLKITKHVYSVSLITMLVWLVHPMHLSTVMYVIQRMTILSSTCMLVGLIFYLKGRLKINERKWTGYAFVSVGVGMFGLLGILFKETAINILIYVCILEGVLLAKANPVREKLFTLWKILFLYIPIGIVVLYFAVNMDLLGEMQSRRAFTMWERFLTECRVLIDYLRNIVFPQLSELTLYHDDYEISRGIFQPLSTFFSFAFILFALVAAWMLRNRVRILSFGVFWYFGGHVLESTFLPLELYFEHRNYLPMIGVIFPVSFYCLHLVGKLKHPARFAYGAYAVLLSWLCFSNAQVWGSPVLLTHIWAEEHKTSKRAINDMVRLYLIAGRKEEARSYMHRIGEIYPDLVSVKLFEMYSFGCRESESSIIDENFVEVTKSAEFDLGAISAIQQLNSKIINGKCPALSDKLYIEIANSLANNPNFVGHRKGVSILYESIARVYFKKRHLNETMEYLDKAYEAYPRYVIALDQALILSSAGLYDDAERYVKLARETVPSNKMRLIWQHKHIDRVADRIKRARSRNQMQHEERRVQGSLKEGTLNADVSFEPDHLE